MMISSGKPQRSVFIIAHGIDGGIAPLASTLACGLKDKGWQSAVRYVGRPAASKFVSVDQKRGVDSAVIVTGRARSVAEAFGLLFSLFSIARAVRKNRPSVVVFGGFIPALIYPLFLRLVTSATFVFWDHAPQNTFLAVKKILFPLPLACIDRIVSISNSTAAALTKYFGIPQSKITFIPNGIDPGRWAVLPSPPDISKLRIIMPARLDLNQKDQPTLIRAAALLREKGSDVELTLVGSGIDEPVIRKVVQECRASKFVHLIGHSDDVTALVAAHNVLCLSTKFEGLPTVLIEGMMARRAVVASRVEGCRDVIRDKENGFLFEAGSAQDCADTLSELQRYPELENIVNFAHQEAIRLYSPTSMIGAFEKAISQD